MIISFLAALVVASVTYSAVPTDSQVVLDVIYNRAVDKFNQRSYAEARIDLDYLVARKFDRPIIYFFLGKIYRTPQHLNNERALEYFQKFLSTSQNATLKPIASTHVAYLQLRLARYADAVKSITPVHEASSTAFEEVALCFATVHNSIGMKALGRKSFLEALSHFNLAVTAQPDRPELVNNLSNTYLRIAERGDMVASTKPMPTSCDLALELINRYEMSGRRMTPRLKETKAYALKLCKEMRRRLRIPDDILLRGGSASPL